MNNAIVRFNNSFQRINGLHSLYIHLLEEKGFNHIIIADILRSEIVYVISALDRLIHDLVLEGVIDIYLGNRNETPSYKNITINVVDHKNLNSAQFPVLELKGIIIERHKYFAFQEPEKISNALSLITLEQHKWQNISNRLGITESDCKTTLKNIVLRRNQIVHESDIDLLTGIEQNIFKEDVEDIVKFIYKIGNEIFNLVKQ